MFRFSVAALAMLLVLVSGVEAADADSTGLKKASVSRVKMFGSMLKGELKAAIDHGGAEEAVRVCHEKAPAIGQKMSEQGWTVGRTSSQWRSADNKPDAWEAKVLASFEARKAKGEDVAKMAFGEVVEKDGHQVWRFMKAIPTAAVCTTCHGAEVDKKLKAKLKGLYPGDQAYGFREGDIRGAFSLQKKL